MTFEEILDQAIAMLQRRGRVSYRALKRQFDLDEAYVEDLKLELIEVHRVAMDQDSTMLVWTGAAASASTPEPVQAPAPSTYTPAYLAEKILTCKRALEGERKQVTVLFADLKGSTELIRDLDPETAQHLLDPALQHMMAAVHRYEGTVNQVLGDGIMALFGAPLAHEDHAVRACYAALAMQDALRRYANEVRRTHGVPVQMRVGLHSGEVVVRAIGNDLHMDYSAVGLTTVLAARMEQLATPGSILLTAATLRLVEGLVRVNALGPMPVKGLTEPVEVFEVLGASAIRRRLQAAAVRGLTRFVGRQTEMAALCHTLERAAAGQGQVMAVVGEAGVGKSRLIYEFVHSHHTRGWLVLESASVSYGKATPYFPVIDLLKRYTHLEEHDDVRTIRAKVTGQVLTLDATLQDILPPLLTLLEALPDDSPFRQLAPPQRRQRTLEALKRLLLRESHVQPLLLVFEDLHWIDAETQALLDSLIESLPTTQVLLLVNYRPEYQHGWGSKTYYLQVRLDPLPSASADELLQDLLGDDPGLDALKRLLIARTEGNPFFLEECVRTLVETQVLVGEPGAYHLAQALATIQVPATVQAVLAARLDRLLPEEKRLLQTAAVIGTEVPLLLLQAIAELPEDALHHGLTHLQAAEFLYETSLFPERVYTFKHALTHEVAYGSLLQEQRRGLHAKVVEALERLPADRLAEQVERLAHHAFRGEAWDKVVLYARQAGVRGFDRSAYAQAGAYLDQALEALTRLPETRETTEQHCDLLCVRSAPHAALGEYAQQLACGEAAVPLAETLGDQGRLVQAVSAAANALWQMGDNVRAHVFAQRGFALAEAVGDTVPLIDIGLNLGMILCTMGDYRRAAVVLAKPVALLQGDLARALLGRATYPAVRARVALTWCLVELGEFRQASAVVEEGMQIAEALQQPSSLLQAHYSACYLLFGQGKFHNAIPRLERSLARWNTSDGAGSYHECAGALGYAYAMTGRLAEAFPLLEQAVERARRVNRRSETRVLGYLVDAYLHAGQPGDASAAATRMLDLSRERCERGAEAWALQRLGEIHAQCEPPDTEQAETYYHQALALAEELGQRPLQAHCHRGLGILYAQTGQAEQARVALSAAITLYRAMDMTFWLPQTEAALAQVEGQ